MILKFQELVKKIYRNMKRDPQMDAFVYHRLLVDGSLNLNLLLYR